MASTFSPTLRIELIGDGDQSGIWGQTTNANLGTLIEQAITGVQTITMADANYTLTSFNGVADEARNAVLVITGTNSQQRNVIAPLVEKVYIIKNSTTGGFAIQIIGASGTGVVIPNGVTAMVYCDGTNFLPAQVDTVGNQTVNGNLAVTGTTTLTGTLTASTGAFSGVLTAPTAAPGTNNTQVATTAFVQTITGSFGTMAQQNANNVNITGGSITGITDLAIADGGTGASTAANARTNLGLGSIATQSASSVAITGGSITGITDLAIADGGTGASDAATARSNLGLGSIATQASNNVTITGGSITGITDLAIADGGTGASTAANARTNLGLGTMATQDANNVAITGGSANSVTVTNYTESVVAIGTVSTSHTFSLTNGTVQTATLTASTACTFTMPTAVAGKSFVVLLKQAAVTGNGTATFTGVKWSVFGTPTVTATAGKMDIFTFFSDGTNWYGSYTQGYTP